MSSRPREFAVAFATHAAHPAIQDDDCTVAQLLAQRGCQVTACVWSDRSVDWAEFDAIVIRSCWDYHVRGGEFLAWLARLEALGVLVLNPAPILRSNLDKRYLLQLQALGLPVVPTRALDEITESSLGSAMSELGGDRWVLKPVMSAGAHRTWLLDRAQIAADLAQFSDCAEPGTMLLQPYVSDIENTGELSLLYFGGQFSHAVVKRPRSGDFRVQEAFGGTASAGQASADCIASGAIALAVLLAADACYARVDMVNSQRGHQIMEVELLEPDLYLRLAPPQANQNFAMAIWHALLGNSRLTA